MQWQANPPSKLVEEICKQATELGTMFADCVDGLLLDPRTATVDDLNPLASISIQLGISDVNLIIYTNYKVILIKEW